MELKRTAGLVAMIGLSSLLFPALAQQQSDAQSHRRARIVEDQNLPKAATFQRQPIGLYAVPNPGGAGAQDLIQNLAPAGQRLYYYATGNPVSNEEMELAGRAEELARKLGEASPETDKSKIKAQLKDVLEKQFDLRQKRHLDEIKALEAKVKKLKDLVEKRQENRGEIVAKRIDQILSDAEGLGW